MKILIQNGHVVDPLTGVDEVCDVLVRDTDIEKVEKNLQAEADRVIDASGCYVMPGFIDLHVHLRDPGLTQKETLSTGGMAAARGGVTTVCAMPNTKPVIDTKEKVEEVHRRAKEESLVHVIQLGSMTMGECGEELSDIEGMAQAGCYALSEDGKSVMNAFLFRKAMRKAKENDLLIFSHCEDISMVEGGVMNAGKRAEELGVKGITNSVEDVIVARDILIAKELDATLHLCHCSTADSVRMIKDAKEAGLKVTGEVCPHHFILTDEDIPEDNGIWKMNPPLRSRADRDALLAGITDGTIEVIATDHAPHTAAEKSRGLAASAMGVVGLECAFPLLYKYMVLPGIITLEKLIALMAVNPRRIFGLGGGLHVGDQADFTVLDLDARYRVDPATFLSMGRATPFAGWEVQGRAAMTVVGGREVFRDETMKTNR